MIGTGDPAQCTMEMDYLFKADYTCFTRPCSFAGIYQPPFRTNRKFYGTSVRTVGGSKSFKRVGGFLTSEMTKLGFRVKSQWGFMS